MKVLFWNIVGIGNVESRIAFKILSSSSSSIDVLFVNESCLHRTNSLSFSYQKIKKKSNIISNINELAKIKIGQSQV